MTVQRKSDDALAAWVRIPEAIEQAIRGLREEDLDSRGGSNGWSIRETVHHLVEANLIASNIVIAALAGTASLYDWSWVNPDGQWMERLGYQRASVAPAIGTLRALGGYMALLVASVTGSRTREIRLLDAPAAEPRAVTVEQILRDEVRHAQDHLADVAATRKHHAR
jgi:hypothetical protein